MLLLVPRARGGGVMDEHRGTLPQSSGDVHVLFPALLPRHEDEHLALSRDARRGPAGRRARFLGPRHQIQRFGGDIFKFNLMFVN